MKRISFGKSGNNNNGSLINGSKMSFHGAFTRETQEVTEANTTDFALTNERATRTSKNYMDQEVDTYLRRFRGKNN